MKTINSLELPVKGAPILYADGVHDDSAALQWHIDQGLPIAGGHFLISKTVILDGRGYIDGNVLLFGPRIKLLARAVHNAFEAQP